MTDKKLTVAVAQKVMGWAIGPESEWEPLVHWEHAMGLADEFEGLLEMRRELKQPWRCKATITGVVGEAVEDHGPRAITLAIARSVGVVAK